MMKMLVRNNLNILGYYISLAINAASPIILTPIVVSRLGFEAWGTFSVFQTVGLILTMLIDYNFSLSANKDIAINRAHNERVRLIVSRVFSYQIYSSLIILALSISIYMLVRSIYHFRLSI